MSDGYDVVRDCAECDKRHALIMKQAKRVAELRAKVEMLRNEIKRQNAGWGKDSDDLHEAKIKINELSQQVGRAFFVKAENESLQAKVEELLAERETINNEIDAICQMLNAGYKEQAIAAIYKLREPPGEQSDG